MTGPMIPCWVDPDDDGDIGSFGMDPSDLLSDDSDDDAGSFATDFGMDPSDILADDSDDESFATDFGMDPSDIVTDESDDGSFGMGSGDALLDESDDDAGFGMDPSDTLSDDSADDALASAISDYKGKQSEERDYAKSQRAADRSAEYRGLPQEPAYHSRGGRGGRNMRS